MQTKQQVEAEFKAKLAALLAEYGTEIEAKDYYTGYAECGEDIRMMVYVDGIYDNDGNCLREFTEIDLGNYFKDAK